MIDIDGQIERIRWRGTYNVNGTWMKNSLCVPLII